MDYSYDKIIGSQIRRHRMQRGWTQEQLCARLQMRGCDIARSALAKIESGQRHIYAYEIKMFKEALNVSFDLLLV